MLIILICNTKPLCDEKIASRGKGRKQLEASKAGATCNVNHTFAHVSAYTSRPQRASACMSHYMPHTLTRMTRILIVLLQGRGHVATDLGHSVDQTRNDITNPRHRRSQSHHRASFWREAQLSRIHHHRKRDLPHDHPDRHRYAQRPPCAFGLEQG